MREFKAVNNPPALEDNRDCYHFYQTESPTDESLEAQPQILIGPLFNVFDA